MAKHRTVSTPWLGGLLEQALDGALVGALNAAIIGDQFERLRTGDRFWYENMFSGSILDWINDRSFADIILDNTGISWLQDNVFVAVARGVISAPGGILLILLAGGALFRRQRRLSLA